MTDSRSRSWSRGVATLVACAFLGTACGRPPPPPFSRAETDLALAPARDLRARCYAGSALERAGNRVVLEYQLDVAADGSVRSIPRLAEPEQPQLIECVRARLNRLRFPARSKDRITLRFELGPEKSTSIDTVKSGPPQQVGTCEPACSDGFSCRYEPGGPRGGVCVVAPGRCRFGQDCAPSQTCQRLAEPLGVCQERGL